jgi:hypothetical protein
MMAIPSEANRGNMRNRSFAGATSVASLAVALAFTTSAGAADIASPPETPQLAAPPADNGWVFQTTMYGWATALSGNLRTTPAVKEVHAYLPFKTILNHLDGVFMGAFEAKYGRFVFYNDLVYAKIGAAGNFDRGDFTFGLSLSSTIATDIATAGYRLIDDPRFSVDALAGVRGFYTDNTISVLASLFRAHSIDYGLVKSWAIPVAGVHARYNFTDKFFATAAGFVGGTNASSDFSWDLFGGVGYTFNNYVSAFGGWRSLKIGYRNGNFIYNVLLQGPVSGLNIRF